jgi:uncharacterized membrane protein YgcG
LRRPLLKSAIIAALVPITMISLVQAGFDFALFADSACTVPLSRIDWRTLTPGENVTRDVYLKNLANLSITEFHVAASGFQPPTAANYLSVTLSLAAGESAKLPLAPQSTIHLILDLAVSPAVQGVTNFAFNITLTVVYTSTTGEGSAGGGGFGGGSQSQMVPSGAGSNGNGGGSFDSAGLLGIVALCVVAYVLVGGKRK